MREESRKRFDAGMSAVDAADDIDISDFAGWGDTERIAVNVGDRLPRVRPGARAGAEPPELFVRMARWAARH